MDTIIRTPEAAVIRIVKEFYSMLKTTEKDKWDCRVRFRGLGDLDCVNALCGISSYDGSVRLQTLPQQNFDPIDITNVICEGRQVEWTMTAMEYIINIFHSPFLCVEGLAWFKFVSWLLLRQHFGDVL